MAWEKRIVTDQNVEFPNRFKIDGVSKTIEPDFGTVVDAGTPINKAYLQPIEDFLEEIDNRQETHEAENATLEDFGHVEHGTLTATIPTSSWTGSKAPYSKTITVTGMLATDNPIVDVDLSEAEDYEEEQEIITAWGNIYRIITDEDEITVYATAVPEVDIPIQLKVVR